VLHDVAIRPFLEQPSREVAPPFIVGSAAHIELHKGAGFLNIFPRRAGFAGLQADDRIADAQGVARLHGEVSRDAVALVEQADHGNALRHRRAGQGRGAAVADFLPLDLHRASLIGGGDIIAAARREGQQQSKGQDRQGRARRSPDHDASGLHAS
jgi:hypothetical protein